MKSTGPGVKKHRSYFEGWYLKLQSQAETVGLIPAFHVDEKRQASASIQVITEKDSFCVQFPPESFYINRKQLFVRLEKSTFTRQGCNLDVQTKDYSLKGVIDFGPFSSPAYDMMGIFRIIPGLECRHSVFSLYHNVNGFLELNGRQFRFNNAGGYMEGDRGTSFPKRYIWTHCCWGGNSIMLSIADVPIGWTSFVGCIGFVFLNGKEHRIATYCGVKLLHITPNTVFLRQGTWSLYVKLLEHSGHPLQAPVKGGMTRIIRESPSCRVRYTCRIKNQVLFDFVSEQASFENNW